MKYEIDRFSERDNRNERGSYRHEHNHDITKYMTTSRHTHKACVYVCTCVFGVADTLFVLLSAFLRRQHRNRIFVVCIQNESNKQRPDDL